MDDLFNLAFEDVYRGARDDIKTRLAFYEPLLKSLSQHRDMAKAIDLGCGRGEWLELLRANHIDAQGVDLDEEMLIRCRAYGLKTQKIDAISALKALPDNAVGLVSAFHLIEHLPFESLLVLLKEAFRVLMPGGLLLLETPNPENLAVASQWFYLDPSHQKPLPPELMRFSAEFSGFYRPKILRLNEPSKIQSSANIDLLDLFVSVSPDYALLAQKPADEKTLELFDAVFDKDSGAHLASLATRYQRQEDWKRDDLESRLLQEVASNAAQHLALEGRHQHLEAQHLALEGRHQHLEAQHLALEARYQHLEQLFFKSWAWKVASPFRFINRQYSLLKQQGWRARIKAALKKCATALLPVDRYLREHCPAIHKFCMSILRLLGVNARLHAWYIAKNQAIWVQTFQQAKDLSSETTLSAPPSTQEAIPEYLSKSARKIYLALSTQLQTRREQ